MASANPVTGEPHEGQRALALADLLRQATQASLEPRAVLEVVVRWCTRTFGDVAVVRILGADDRTLETAAGAGGDPESADELPDLPEGEDTLALDVLRRDQPIMVLEDPRPLMIAPLRSRGRVLGTLTVARRGGRGPYRQSDLQLLGEIGARLGLVYENARLYDRSRLHAATLEHVDAAVCAIDADGAITAFNPAAERMFGWREAEILGCGPAELVAGEPVERRDALRAAVARDGRYSGPVRLRRSDGRDFPGHVNAVAVHDDRGELTGMVSVFLDLTERTRLIDALERRAAQQAAVAALGERALEVEDPSILLDHAVESVRDTLGVELAGVFELVDDERALALRAGSGFERGSVRGAVVPAGWQDGQEGFTLIRHEPVIVDDAADERRFAQSELLARHGAVSGVTVVVQGRQGARAVLAAHSRRVAAFTADDVTFLQAMANVLGHALDRFGIEEEVRRRSLHDPLTDLPNRELVMDRLAQAAGRLDRTSTKVALMFCDLDHFKNVNDSLGHRAGDQVLREVAQRLTGAVRPGDTVGRFGGDEFVVLCEEVDGELMALAIAERLLRAFDRPFRVEGDEHVLGVSIGIALLHGEQDLEALLRDADVAMYRAKESGRGRVELFDIGMRDEAESRLKVEAGLRRALDGTELELRYQPIVGLVDGSIAAVEALVRWRHPERGLLSPDVFVGVAEESGLIVGLGRRVLELACEQAAAWARLRPDDAPLPVHVNLSPRQLHDPALVQTVRSTLAAAGARPSALALEITESTLIDRGPGRLALLQELRDLGVELLLDDFGTGWSSLSYLAQLPISGLKIDRSFVAGLAAGHAPIVDAIVRLARAFALPVIAEGIEDATQLRALRRLGCELGQGFHFAQPMTAQELTAHLAADRPPFARRERAA